LDIYESAEEIIVLADLAGLNKDEIHIELSRKRIKIAGVRKAIMIMTNARYSLAEIPHGYFERTLSLPALVDVESAVASYANGLLMVRIKKMPAGKTLRVQIKSNNE
jgi:HSP20 family protein